IAPLGRSWKNQLARGLRVARLTATYRRQCRGSRTERGAKASCSQLQRLGFGAFRFPFAL
ncbi:unnamed protein product, partial [Symbiodinium necroappetens]